MDINREKDRGKDRETKTERQRQRDFKELDGMTVGTVKYEICRTGQQARDTEKSC